MSAGQLKEGPEPALHADLNACHWQWSGWMVWTASGIELEDDDPPGFQDRRFCRRQGPLVRVVRGPGWQCVFRCGSSSNLGE